MEFHILGRSLTVLTDSALHVNIPRSQVRAAISMFVLHTDVVLPPTEIMDLVWDDPDVGIDALRSCIYRVRQSLGRDRVETIDGAYRFRSRPGEIIDLHRFRELHKRGVAAHHAGDDVEAGRLLGDGLELWGDPPLGDLPQTTAMASLTTALIDERASAHEALVAVRLALGQHQELLPDLRRWAAGDPLNERLRTHVMLALYRCGRKAEALDFYDHARESLGEAGIRPGTELKRMRDRIHTDDPALNSTDPAGWPGTVLSGSQPIRQLPPDVADFTGRDQQHDYLTALLTPPPVPTMVPIAEVIGAPGVGKTSLAVHVAHLLSEHYPDGQLHFQLAGASATPREPGAVLHEALRALGVAATDIPESLEQRAALYRSRLAGRKILVVADDAAGPEQVRPLQPGSIGCAMIVTSRTQLTGLTGGQLCNLGPLTDSEARRLLSRIIGDRRIADESAAVRDLVDTCAGLPLALRIVGARLATRPTWPLAHLVGLLQDRRKRLDQLQAGDLAIRASIAASYDLLPTDAARAFRLLSLIGPHDAADWVLAMLLDRSNADDVIDTLLYRCLLTDAGVDSTGEPRYRMHDLIREFAAERLAEDPEHDVALTRLGVGWLELVDIADASTPYLPYSPGTPHYPGQDMAVSVPAARQLVSSDPQAWLRIEHPNAQVVAHAMARAGKITIAYDIALRLSAFLHLNGHHSNAEELWRVVAAEADRIGHDRIAALSKLRAAMVIGADRLHHARAMLLLDDIIPALEMSGDQNSLANALATRAYCAQFLSMREAGRETLLDLAHHDAKKSLELARSVANGHAEFSSLRVLGLTFSQIGQNDEAVRYCTEAVSVARDLKQDTYEGLAVFSLIQVFLRADAHIDALRWAEIGLGLATGIDHVLAIAYFQQVKGFALQGLHRHNEAIDVLTAAIEGFQRQKYEEPAAACQLRIADSYRALRHQDAGRTDT